MAHTKFFIFQNQEMTHCNIFELCYWQISDVFSAERQLQRSFGSSPAYSGSLLLLKHAHQDPILFRTTQEVNTMLHLLWHQNTEQCVKKIDEWHFIFSSSKHCTWKIARGVLRPGTGRLLSLLCASSTTSWALTQASSVCSPLCFP